MTINTGTRFGRYEIRSKLGEGGMGEVYLAQDIQLRRLVALKVLPSQFAQSSERLVRFEQEACAASALNHPNILSIYDVGAHDGSPYVVSELLEGETLRDRLNGARLPPRKATDYALQLARGLSAAHEKGIVHRDLKPENIFITNDGRVKILDFGLAKLVESANGDKAQTDVPTRRVNTGAGMVMGTVGYMSPEQVRGRTVDHRADIFSFGTVFYEMLSGKRAFRGDSVVETLNAILKEDPPDLSETGQNVAPGLKRVAQHCLEKNPAERFQSASDLAFALEALSGSSVSAQMETAALAPEPTRAKWRTHLSWFVASLAGLLALTAFTLLYLRRAPEETNVVRFPVVIPEGYIPYTDVETNSMAVSPDGRYLAFIAVSGGQRTLAVRPLGALAAQPLNGTEGAYSLFWSPDSRDMAFFADGKLKRIEVSGNSLQTVCSLPAGGNGTGSWSSNGTIVFSEQPDNNIYGVPAGGGTPSLLVKGRKGSPRRWIQFLPDGRRFLFYKFNEQENNAGLYAGSLDSSEIRQVAPLAPARAQYVKDGYLLYPREGSLVAQALDEKSLRLSGEPVVVVERIAYFDKTGWAEFSASDTGVLAYMSEFPKTRLVWFDRAGRESGQVGAPDYYSVLRLASDGQRVALTINDPRTSSGDLWIQGLTRDTPTRFVSGPDDDSNPVWSPDGKRLAYFSCCDDASTLHLKEVGDTGKGQMPVKDQSFAPPLDWSRDGKYLIYSYSGDLWVLPFYGAAKPYPLMQTPAYENFARFSPDGRWIAFVSDETGRFEVYVTRFDNPGEKWRISTDGGNSPRWRGDGRELFYISADYKLMAVQINPGEKFEAGAPALIFKADPLSQDYDVTSDGQRFLFVASAPGTQTIPFAVVLNWKAELKR